MSLTNESSPERYDDDHQNLIGNYRLEKTIGEGTFGKVKLGYSILTNEKVAIKILEKSKILDKSDSERVSRELTILKRLSHKNVIRLYEVIENHENYYIIMEYASGGELFKYIVDKKKLDEEEASFFFVQIISGLEYIHKIGIVHRDFKPENLLLNENKTIKIIDFGLSNQYKKGHLLKTSCGSPCYAAPEMIQGKKYSGLSIDTWSIGVILFAMVCGYLPFEDKTNDRLYQKIIECKLDFPSYVPERVRDMIKKILEVNPKYRATIEEIKKHSFYKLGEKAYKKEENKYDIEETEKAVYGKMEEMGFDRLEVKCQIDKNRHNNTTAVFYLLCNKMKILSANNEFGGRKGRKSKTVSNHKMLMGTFIENRNIQININNPPSKFEGNISINLNSSKFENGKESYKVKFSSESRVDELRENSKTEEIKIEKKSKSKNEDKLKNVLKANINLATKSKNNSIESTSFKKNITASVNFDCNLINRRKSKEGDQINTMNIDLDSHQVLTKIERTISNNEDSQYRNTVDNSIFTKVVGLKKKPEKIRNEAELKKVVRITETNHSKSKTKQGVKSSNQKLNDSKSINMNDKIPKIIDINLLDSPPKDLSDTNKQKEIRTKNMVSIIDINLDPKNTKEKTNPIKYKSSNQSISKEIKEFKNNPITKKDNSKSISKINTDKNDRERIILARKEVISLVDDLSQVKNIQKKNVSSKTLSNFNPISKKDSVSHTTTTNIIKTNTNNLNMKKIISIEFNQPNNVINKSHYSPKPHLNTNSKLSSPAVDYQSIGKAVKQVANKTSIDVIKFPGDKKYISKSPDSRMIKNEKIDLGPQSKAAIKTNTPNRNQINSKPQINSFSGNVENFCINGLNPIQISEKLKIFCKNNLILIKEINSHSFELKKDNMCAVIELSISSNKDQLKNSNLKVLSKSNDNITKNIMALLVSFLGKN